MESFSKLILSTDLCNVYIVPLKKHFEVMGELFLQDFKTTHLHYKYNMCVSLHSLKQWCYVLFWAALNIE